MGEPVAKTSPENNTKIIQFKPPTQANSQFSDFCLVLVEGEGCAETLDNLSDACFRLAFHEPGDIRMRRKPNVFMLLNVCDQLFQNEDA